MANAKLGINTAIKLLPANKGYLVAVSGGIDSICLLHALNELKRVKKFKLEVAHVDHGLRENSSTDAEFVADLARKMELNLSIKRLIRPTNKVNIEAWARQERYSYFEELRQRSSLDYILTAHHANDVVETLIMRLASNRELRSIVGIDEGRHLLRPLIQVGRSQIENYADRHQLKYVEDSTNSDTDFFRNAVRHKILPMLLEAGGGTTIEALAKRAESLDQDAFALEELARRYSASLGEFKFGSRAWLKALEQMLKQQPAALSWRIVSLTLLPYAARALSRAESFRFIEFVQQKAEGVEFAKGVRLKRQGGGIKLL